MWRYPAEREVRTGGRSHKSVVALPIALIGSIRCWYGGKVRVLATNPSIPYSPETIAISFGVDGGEQ